VGNTASEPVSAPLSFFSEKACTSAFIYADLSIGLPHLIAGFLPPYL